VRMVHDWLKDSKTTLRSAGVFWECVDGNREFLVCVVGIFRRN
jgi:hypothetical protein